MNLDNPSLFINLEQMLIIKSTQFNQKLSKVIKHQINNSNKLEKDLKTYQKTNEKAVPLKKKLLMKITGIILRPFQIFL